jgi:predicted nucleic acid-binding protein
VAGLTLDSGALIQFERADQRVRAWLDEAFRRSEVPTVPSVALVETWRGGARSARVAKLLKACSVEPLDESLAREAGILRGQVSGSTAIDAVVVASAARRADIIPTTDPGDLSLLGEKSAPVQIEAV